MTRGQSTTGRLGSGVGVGLGVGTKAPGAKVTYTVAVTQSVLVQPMLITLFDQ